MQKANLRALQHGDFEQVLSWAEREDCCEFFRRYPPIRMWVTRENFLQVFSSCYAIEDAAGGFVGLITITTLDQTARRADFGLLVDFETADKRDVIESACAQAFRYFFDSLGHNKLTSPVLPHRDRLKALMLSWGFKYEGRLRENVFFAGAFHDEDSFSLTRKDYEEIRGRLPK